MNVSSDECNRECGICCYDTRMLLSRKEVDKIIHSYNAKISERDFTFKLNDNVYQLKNKNGVCFFFDIQSKKCTIYNLRPKGCRFYPLIFDYVQKSCVFDEDCPNLSYFNQKRGELKKACIHLREYIEKDLNILLPKKTS